MIQTLAITLAGVALCLTVWWAAHRLRTHYTTEPDCPRSHDGICAGCFCGAANYTEEASR